jgi:hypothetical protein
MADSGGVAWNLESFVDSLIVELDSVQNRLAVKGLSRPLTYMVKDVDVDLQVFPDYDGRRVRFRTARAGEPGASKISLQLGSISDRQIREATRGPVTMDDLSLDSIEDLDEDVKADLKAIGVSSVSDLERVERRGVDLNSVSKKGIDYGSLASAINKARRRKTPPQVSRVQTMTVRGEPCIVLVGRNLSVQDDPRFPFVHIDGVEARIAEADESRVAVVPTRPLAPTSRLQMALDPYAILSMTIRTRGTPS